MAPQCMARLGLYLSENIWHPMVCKGPETLTEWKFESVTDYGWTDQLGRCRICLRTWKSKADFPLPTLLTQAVGPSLAVTTNHSYARRTRTHGGATSSSRCRGAKEGRRASSPCPGQEPATTRPGRNFDKFKVWKFGHLQDQVGKFNFFESLKVWKFAH